MRSSFFLTASFVALASATTVNGSAPTFWHGSAPTFWREQMEHNGRPAYLNSEDADLYSVWRDVRNVTFAGGVKCDGETDDSAAIQAAINYGTGGVLWSRVNRAEQMTLPAYVYIPEGIYVIKKSLQLYVNTVLVGDPLNMPRFAADPSLGTDSMVYMYDAGFGKSTTTQFYQGVRNIEFDTTGVPANISATGVNTPGSQACFLQNCKFTMTVGSEHIGVQMYGPDNAGGSGILLGDLSFYGGSTGIVLNNQQYIFKNMTFDSVTTAVAVEHVYTAAFLGLSFINCQVGINVTNSSTSLSVIDSSCTDTLFCIQIQSDLTLVIDNFENSNSAGTSLYNLSSKSTLLSGSIEPGTVWLLGPTFEMPSPFGMLSNSNHDYDTSDPKWKQLHEAYEEKHSKWFTTSIKVRRPLNLVDKIHSKWFTTAQPQYEDVPITEFMNLKSDFGALGDGKTDDTEAIRRAVHESSTQEKILFVPQGTYLISSTVYVPAGTRIVGEVWSTFNAIGDYFSDDLFPKPMLQVGLAGEIGVAHFSDVAFSVGGVLPGAILVEVNLAGKNQGDVGFWNSHFRVGGWVGAGDMRYKCQADDTSDCKAVFLMLHLKTTSSVYVENMWGWTADHDLDGGPTMNIAAGRGILVEATEGTWLVGTSFEHNALYQYQLYNATNVFIAMQQTESPYWQGPGSPNLAPDPWFSSTHNNAFNDPTFDDCSDEPIIVSSSFSESYNDTLEEPFQGKIMGLCRMAYAMRVIHSKEVHVYNSGFWVFFNHWQPGNYSDTVELGQWRCSTIQQLVGKLYWFNIDTRACEFIVDTREVLAGYNATVDITQQVAPGSWGGAIAGYLAHGEMPYWNVWDRKYTRDGEEPLGNI